MPSAIYTKVKIKLEKNINKAVKKGKTVSQILKHLITQLFT